MIREINAIAQVREILRGRPYFEGCIQTAFECYCSHPSVARFYRIENTAVLMQMGKAALLCGEVKDTDELSSFLHFSGVTSLKTDGTVPCGFTAEGLLIMQYSSEIIYLPPKGVELDVNPNLRRLSQGACFYKNSPETTDEFYADACTRKARGLADIWAISENGEYVSTAGVYSLQKQEAYISAVATAYHSRDRGFASYLVYSLAEKYQDRRVVLVCEEKLRGFYETIGFSRLGTIILCKANKPLSAFV